MTHLWIGAGAEISPGDAEALQQLCAKLPPEPMLCEVGSWRGQGSTQILARAGKLVCVDHWRGNDAAPHHAQFRAVSDPYQHFLANTKQLSVLPHKGSSRDWAPKFDDGYFDLIFIDADHRYAGVKDDILLWMPKVKPGGILAGHDCEMRPDDRCRQALKERPDLEWIDIPGTPMSGAHYGVACAVDELFGFRAMLFAEHGLKSSVWWVPV